MEKDNYRDELIQAYKSKSLFEKITQIYLAEIRSSSKILPTLLAEIHNEKLLDLNKFFQILDTESNKRDLYILFNTYSLALPMMSCSIEDVLITIEQLNKKNKSSIDIHDGIYNFCKHDLLYAQQGLYYIKENPENLTSYISSVISSANSHDPTWCLSQTQSLISSSDHSIRSQAYWTIGRLQLTNECDIILAKSLLNASSDNEDNNIANINLLRALINFGKNHSQCWHDIKNSISHILHKNDDDILTSAAQQCLWEFQKIPNDIFHLLLDAVKKNPLKSEALNSIDLLFIDLIKNNQHDLAIALLEDILAKNNNIGITSFDSFNHYLIKENNTLFCKLVTKWLLSGKNQLCRSVLDLFNNIHDEILESHVDKELCADLSENIKLYLSRKIIGWLITKPTDVFTLISSVYVISSHQLQNKLEDLLFDPLFINYPRDLGKYLEIRKEKEGDNSLIALIHNLEIRMKNYVNGYEQVYSIKELKTPDNNRHLYWKMSDRLMQKAKNNGPKSIFEDMFNIKHLLYGNSSIYYMHSSTNEKPQRTETPMHTFSYSSEIPNMDIIDPFNFNYRLLRFRIERIEDEINN
ncbi:hypothetical protein [Enterobacter sp. Bisph1]|uniref:hypothetical protein n=1 Tax=Enterobacter sp. Bisph1 TaxID=1274399 RepID=UPI00057C08A4|nr:hypothetical protein [Enterobacter sp. Bisph1]